MTITNEKPPQWILDEVKKKWGVEWESDLVFSYAPNIHTASGNNVTGDLVAHEEHHHKQQAEVGGPDKWWKKYLRDSDFRLRQEIEAYQIQYQWILKNVKGRNQRFKYLDFYSKALSSPVYGNITTWAEAMYMIRENKLIPRLAGKEANCLVS